MEQKKNFKTILIAVCWQEPCWDSAMACQQR